MKTNIVKKISDYSFKRIIIIGCPGSGKSTLTKELSEILNLPAVHLDKLYWLPNWVNVSEEEFDKKLDLELKKESWIIDGNYNRTLKRRIKSCDLIIYLDYDSKTCLDSYQNRVSKGAIKDFITEGCIEEVDEEFIDLIKNYNKTYRQSNYNLIGNSNKMYLILINRDECNEFVDSLR